MEFTDHLEAMKEGMYEMLPRNSEAWQYDVWEHGFRVPVAQQAKKQLRTFSLAEPLTEVGRAVRDDMRMDLFGIKPDGTPRYGAPDQPGHSVAKLIPRLDETTPEDVAEALDFLAAQSTYKLHKWGSGTQVRELADLCETAPAIHLPAYQRVIAGTFVVAGRAAAVMHCDMDTKPNFRNMQDRVRLLKSITDVGERLWTLLKESQE